MKTCQLRKALRFWGGVPLLPCAVAILGSMNLCGGLAKDNEATCTSVAHSVLLLSDKRVPAHVLLSDDFDTYEAGVLVGQGGWAQSEDLEEAPKQAEITRPGLGGSGGALFLREGGQGASKALSRAVGDETIVVEFDFLPATLQRPLTLGLRAGPVGDHVRGSVSAHLKLDGGKCFLLRKSPAKWTPFEGVSWEAGKRMRVRLLVDYVTNLARIEVDGVRSPTAIGDWWTQAKPANIDITAQFGGGGSTLDNLVITTLAGGAS